MNYLSGAGRQLDGSRIPEKLRGVQHLVEKWGISDQADQDRFVSYMMANHRPEAFEFVEVISRLQDSIVEWGKDLSGPYRERIGELADDVTHPYWAYLDALNVSDLIDAPREQDAEANERVRLEKLQLRLANVLPQAEQLFRNRDYTGFAELMQPYQELLTPAQLAKLSLALRKSRSDGTG